MERIRVISNSYTTLMLHGKISGLQDLLRTIEKTTIDSYDLFRDMIRAACGSEPDVMHPVVAQATGYSEDTTRAWVYFGPVPRKSKWKDIISKVREAIKLRIDQLNAIYLSEMKMTH